MDLLMPDKEQKMYLFKVIIRRFVGCGSAKGATQQVYTWDELTYFLRHLLDEIRRDDKTLKCLKDYRIKHSNGYDLQELLKYLKAYHVETLDFKIFNIYAFKREEDILKSMEVEVPEVSD